MSDFTPKGLLDPVLCKKNRWIITIIVIIKGRIKCREKNRVNVELSTENPPQIQLTKVDPRYGIADIKFVITVAPQNDICPHGRTYPKNAVAIVVNIIIIPITQVLINLYDE